MSESAVWSVQTMDYYVVRKNEVLMPQHGSALNERALHKRPHVCNSMFIKCPGKRHKGRGKEEWGVPANGYWVSFWVMKML